ncbi:MAG: transposase [Thermodesulfovibrionales bacterium]|jgi:transposase-like protein
MAERKNKYAHRAKITETKMRQLLRFFAVGLDATQIAELTGMNRNTVNRYLSEIRLRIALYCETQSAISVTLPAERPASADSLWTDGGKAGKGIIFGLIKRDGKIYTELVSEASAPVYQAVIKGKRTADSLVSADDWRGYHGVVDVGYGKHFRFESDQGNELPADSAAVQGQTRKQNGISGTEGFWGYAKTRLTRFRGLSRSVFYLHLKECEFRFNYRDQDIYKIIMDIVRRQPLFTD